MEVRAQTQERGAAAKEIVEHSRVRAAMTLNLWLKTDDFPFNAPSRSLLSYVLPGTVTAQMLSFCFTITSSQTAHPPTHTPIILFQSLPLFTYCTAQYLTMEASRTILDSLQDTGGGNRG